MKARAFKGRLVMDEPTDLPDGTEVELEIVDDGGWGDSPEEVAEIERALAEAREEAKAGRLIPADEFLAGFGKRR